MMMMFSHLFVSLKSNPVVTKQAENKNRLDGRKRVPFFYHHFCFPAQLVGGSTLSDLLDKSWSQVSSLLPSGMCLHFYRAWGSAFPPLVDYHRMLLLNALALSANQFLCKKKSLQLCALGEN